MKAYVYTFKANQMNEKVSKYVTLKAIEFLNSLGVVPKSYMGALLKKKYTFQQVVKYLKKKCNVKLLTNGKGSYKFYIQIKEVM